MKIQIHVFAIAFLALAKMAFAADNAPTANPETAGQSRALSAARSLVPGYFTTHYQGTGEELKCELRLDQPIPVEGWPGRWRVHGLATLRHYKDPVAHQELVERENAIRNNKSLSARQIQNQVESLYFIRSEIVKFDAEVSKLDSVPEIDVTIR